MGYFTLPQNTTKLNELCQAYHTTGQLCGECMDGYGWVITPVAQSTKCRSEVTIACTAQLLFLLLKILYDIVVVVRFFQISFWKNDRLHDVFSALFLLIYKTGFR